MADLFMTIDSDSDADTKKTKNQTKNGNEKAEDEILLGHSVILNDFEDNRPNRQTKTFTVGSRSMWNFANAIQVDNPNGLDLGNNGVD